MIGKHYATQTLCFNHKSISQKAIVFVNTVFIYHFIVMETHSKWYVNTEFIVMETLALSLRSIGVWHSAPSAKNCTKQVCLSVAVSVNNCWQGNSII